MLLRFALGEVADVAALTAIQEQLIEDTLALYDLPPLPDKLRRPLVKQITTLGAGASVSVDALGRRLLAALRRPASAASSMGPVIAASRRSPPCSPAPLAMPPRLTPSAAAPSLRQLSARRRWTARRCDPRLHRRGRAQAVGMVGHGHARGPGPGRWRAGPPRALNPLRGKVARKRRPRATTAD